MIILLIFADLYLWIHWIIIYQFLIMFWFPLCHHYFIPRAKHFLFPVLTILPSDLMYLRKPSAILIWQSPLIWVISQVSYGTSGSDVHRPHFLFFILSNWIFSSGICDVYKHGGGWVKAPSHILSHPLRHSYTWPQINSFVTWLQVTALPLLNSAI